MGDNYENHMVMAEPDEPEQVATCDICGSPIYKYYDYYDVDGEIYCETCFEAQCDEWRKCDGC